MGAWASRLLAPSRRASGKHGGPPQEVALPIAPLAGGSLVAEAPGSQGSSSSSGCTYAPPGIANPSVTALYRTQLEASGFERMEFTIVRLRGRKRVGIRITNEADHWATHLKDSPFRFPEVTGLDEGSPAAVSGLRLRDRVVSIDGVETHTSDAACSILKGGQGETKRCVVLRPCDVERALQQSMQEVAAVGERAPDGAGAEAEEEYQFKLALAASYATAAEDEQMRQAGLLSGTSAHSALPPSVGVGILIREPTLSTMGDSGAGAASGSGSGGGSGGSSARSLSSADDVMSAVPHSTVHTHETAPYMTSKAKGKAKIQYELGA